MPKGTLVERIFTALKKKMSVEKAAKIAQSKSGQSLQTGKPPKGK